LEVLDLSNNEISEMSDLSAHRFLKKLYLNNNSITEIQGLEKNKMLEVPKFQKILILRSYNLTTTTSVKSQI